MTAKELIELFDKLSKGLVESAVFSNFTRDFTQQRQAFTANPSSHALTMIKMLESIKFELTHILNLGDESNYVLKAFGVDKYKSVKFIDTLQANIRTNPSSGVTAITKIIQDFTNLNQKCQQIYGLVQTITFPDVSHNSSEGIIEVTYNGKTEINDFVSGKNQFNDWFLIFEGYSRFLGCSKEDFHIVGISKSSPTKIKIKVKLEYASLILSIVTNIVQIIQSTETDKLVIEQIKSSALVSDTLHKQFIKEAENNITSKVNEKIDSLIESVCVDKKHDSEIKGFLKKSVVQQHTFIINGGDIKFNIGESVENTELLLKLEDTKRQILEIKNKLDKLELPPSTDSTESPKGST